MNEEEICEILVKYIVLSALEESIELLWNNAIKALKSADVELKESCLVNDVKRRSKYKCRQVL